MIPLETNSPPGEVDTVIEPLTTGLMIPLETNSPPAGVSIQRTMRFWNKLHQIIHKNDNNMYLKMVGNPQRR